jgi:hypothetical protein
MNKKKLLLILMCFIATQSFSQAEQPQISRETHAPQEQWFPNTYQDFFYYYLPQLGARLMPLVLYRLATQGKKYSLKETLAGFLADYGIYKLMQKVAAELDIPSYTLAYPWAFSIPVALANKEFLKKINFPPMELPNKWLKQLQEAFEQAEEKPA